MKKNVLAILLLSILIIFLSLSTSEAGFLIELKNGRTIYTENYEIEGDKIVLYLKNGIVKFSKDEIKSIVEAKGEIEEDQAEVKKGDKKEVSKEDKKDTPKSPEKGKVEKAPAIGGAEIERYKKKKAEIKTRLDETKRVYFETTNKEEKNKARKIMLSIADEMFGLEKEVKERNNGELPQWWQE